MTKLCDAGATGGATFDGASVDDASADGCFALSRTRITSSMSPWRCCEPCEVTVGGPPMLKGSWDMFETEESPVWLVEGWSGGVGHDSLLTLEGATLSAFVVCCAAFDGSSTA